jgi:hypothetical protein
VQPIQPAGPARRSQRDAGISKLVIVAGLLVVAVVITLLVGTTMHTSGKATASASNVTTGNDHQAQQALSAGLPEASAKAGSRGYAFLDISTLSTSGASVTFGSGPSSNPSTVSVHIVGGHSNNQNKNRNQRTAGASITMADRSSDGVCWFVWRSTESATWYGART